MLNKSTMLLLFKSQAMCDRLTERTIEFFLTEDFDMHYQYVIENNEITPNFSSEGMNMEVIKDNTSIAIECTAALQALYKAAYLMGRNSKGLPENSASNCDSLSQYCRLPVPMKAKSDLTRNQYAGCRHSMLFRKALTIADFNCCITANGGRRRSTADLTILSNQTQMHMSHSYDPGEEHLDFDIVELTRLFELHLEENKRLG